MKNTSDLKQFPLTHEQLIEMLSGYELFREFCRSATGKEQAELRESLRAFGLEKGRTLFTIAQEPGHVFILVEGSVVEVRPFQGMPSKPSIHSDEDDSQYYFKDLLKSEVVDKSHFLHDSKQIHREHLSGSIFGDFMVGELVYIRNCSMLALQNCTLLSLDYKSFKLLVKPYFTRALRSITTSLTQQFGFKVSVNTLIKKNINIEKLQLTKGHVLFNEGEPMQNVFMIEQGTVRSCRLTKNKLINYVLQEYKTYHPGKIIFEQAPQYSAVCLQDCLILRMKRHAFCKLSEVVGVDPATYQECFMPKKFIQLDQYEEELSQIQKIHRFIMRFMGNSVEMPTVLDQLKEQEILIHRSKISTKHNAKQQQMKLLKKCKSVPFRPPRWTQIYQKKKQALCMLEQRSKQRLSQDCRIHNLIERVVSTKPTLVKIKFEQPAQEKWRKLTRSEHNLFRFHKSRR